MGGHHQRNGLFNSVLGHVRHDLFDTRLPVTHPHVCPETSLSCAVQIRFQRLGLLAGEFQQWRAATDEGVAFLYLLHQFRRRGTPAPDVQQVGLDVVQGVRAAVGHKQDADSMRCIGHSLSPNTQHGLRSA